MVDHVFTEEQEDLRAAVRGVLEQEAPEAKVREAMESEIGYDPALWKRLAGELGLQGIIVPEEYGGAGAGLVELGAVYEELGRALYSGPFLSTTLATFALVEVADEPLRSRCLPGIANGELLVTVACDPLLAPDGDAGVVGLSFEGDAAILSGSVGFVLDAHVADAILVVADDVLYSAEPGMPGVRVDPLETVDRTRRMARVTLERARCRRVGSGVSDDVLSMIRDRMVAVLAAEQVGAAQMMLDTAVDYAKVRTQFGRTIGSFQAVKHRLADLSIELDAARSAAYDALWAPGAENLAIPPVTASIAHSYCSETFLNVAAGAIQVLGGIGFTWEHPAHLYYRRAKGSQLMFGSPWWHRRRLAELLGLAAPEAHGPASGT